MKLISIIMPVYNLEEFLEDCIESVLNQTYSNFELILINDGSIDSSASICDRFAELDSRVTVIHQTNGGVSSARNTGLNASKGDFITFVDGDDIISDDYLRHLYTLIETKPSTLISACGLSKFSKAEYLNFESNDYTEHTFSGDNSIKELLYQKIVNAPYAKLFHSKLFNEVRFPLGVKVGEDLLVNIEIFSTNPTVTVSNQRLYGYRIRKGSSISKSTFNDRWIALSELVKSKKKYAHTQELEKAFSNRIFGEAVFASLNLAQELKSSSSTSSHERNIEYLIKDNRRATLSNSAARPLIRLFAFLAYFSPQMPQKFLRIYGKLGEIARDRLSIIYSLKNRLSGH